MDNNYEEVDMSSIISQSTCSTNNSIQTLTFTPKTLGIQNLLPVLENVQDYKSNLKNKFKMTVYSTEPN